jgi:hypothetical protein
MWRVAASLLLCLPVILSALPPILSAQKISTAVLTPGQQVQAVKDIGDIGQAPTVNYRKEEATPFELIAATARQTHAATGVVLGQNPDTLFYTPRSYDLRDADARTALLEAIRGTGYSLKEESGVFVICAGDLTSRQHDLLTHYYQNFGSGPPSTMFELGARLTMWMRAVVNPNGGSAWSILSSTSDERFNLAVIPSATTEEIANRIVTLGSKGMWIFRVAGSPSAESTDAVEIYSYQHDGDIPMPPRQLPH